LSNELEVYFDNAVEEFSQEKGQQFPIKGTRAIIGP
jgi:hypothetical protein